MRVKSFGVKEPNIIPVMPQENSMIGVSSFYLALAKTISGEMIHTVTRYDFRHNKWLFPYSGINELVEYYTDLE